MDVSSVNIAGGADTAALMGCAAERTSAAPALERERASSGGGGGGASLRRSLGFLDGLGVIVGIMIGSGIFASPGMRVRNWELVLSLAPPAIFFIDFKHQKFPQSHVAQPVYRSGAALADAGAAGTALVAWVAAGVLVGLASLAYGELGAAMPCAGGDAEYLLQAYGEPAAFLFVW